jgi:HEAT repeat protein
MNRSNPPRRTRPSCRLGCAVAILLAGCSETPVEQIAAQLQDASHETRYEAAKQLEDYAAEAVDAVPALAITLSDPDPKVRYRSAKALSKIGIGAAGAAEELARALADKSTPPKTHYYVVKALANSEDAAIVALPDLIAVLDGKDPPETRYYAAKAIGKIGREAHAAIAVLQRATRTSDPKLRKAASEALAKVHPE